MTGVSRRLALLGSGLALTMLLGLAGAVGAQDASPGGGLLGPGDVLGSPAPAASPAPQSSPVGVAVPGDPSCAADSEPNDAPETAGSLVAPGCITGTLPDSDQDLFLWTVTDAQASQPWDFTLTASSNTITAAKCCW